jgi:hypothetical protein
MNLGEELFLCAIPEDGVVTAPKVVDGVGAAITAELVLRGKIALSEEGVRLLDATPVGDELIDDLLPQLDDPNFEKTRPEWFITNLGKDRLPKERQRLIDQGAVSLQKGEKRRLIGHKPDWLRVEAAGRDVRERSRSVLAGEADPDEREATLAGLLSACGLVDDAAANERARDLAARSPVPQALFDAAVSRPADGPGPIITS